MKASESPLKKAFQFETIVGLAAARYSNKVLYAVDGMPGIWRRIARSDSGIKAKDGSVLVAFNGVVIELTRDKDLEAELAFAGWKMEEKENSNED